jgi:hypothetical protein
MELHALGRACLLLGRLDDARRKADRAVETSSSQPGFAAYALHLLGDIASHPDGSDLQTGEVYYRQTLAFAEPRRIYREMDMTYWLEQAQAQRSLC